MGGAGFHRAPRTPLGRRRSTRTGERRSIGVGAISAPEQYRRKARQREGMRESGEVPSCRRRPRTMRSQRSGLRSDRGDLQTRTDRLPERAHASRPSGAAPRAMRARSNGALTRLLGAVEPGPGGRREHSRNRQAISCLYRRQRSSVRAECRRVPSPKSRTARNPAETRAMRYFRAPWRWGRRTFLSMRGTRSVSKGKNCEIGRLLAPRDQAAVGAASGLLPRLRARLKRRPRHPPRDANRR